jgi:hypothetical protein
VCQSDYLQSEINEYTNNFIKQHKCVPKIEEVDYDATKVNKISPIHFV